jgi:hypothetical protein
MPKEYLKKRMQNLKLFQKHSQTPLIKVGKTIIPSVLIGTSPFFGAGQFEEKAYTYREKFLNHPEKMAEIFIEAVKLGIPAVQLIPYPTIVEALEIARKETNVKIAIVGSLLPNNIQESLETLASLEPQAIMVHGAITDERNPSLLKKWINKIKELGLLTGVVSHEPAKTLPWLDKNHEELNYELIMLPINISGYITGKNTAKVLQWVEKTKKTVIAMKTLVESNTTIKEALTYSMLQKNVKAIAVGITSKNEAKETLTTLKTLLKEKQK